MTPLPIDPLLPDLVRAARAHQAVVLEAPPGAGKTTRVPPALLDAGVAGDKEIVVLQPRRLATRLAAARVAEERQEKPGETVGYQIRFEDVSGPKTRIRFVTEGILTRRLVSDPTLSKVGVVVLDEFHERHLAGDLALSLVRRLQKTTRPDLKLLVMSATLDAAPIAKWLDDAPILRSEGRPFDVTLEYLEQEDPRPLDQQVLAAVKRLVQKDLDGHVLVFLPGAGEIRRAADALAEFAPRHQLDVYPLHGDLPAAEQDKALKPSSRRKIILSTNVAETSVTIDGIAAVVDSGVARVATHSPWSGLPALKLAKVSRSSAIQRAGRAGRTRAGACVRLYTRGDFEGRPQSDAPEIRRLDFTEAALALHALGVTDFAAFPFFEPPPAAALEASDTLLRKLGAVSKDGALTATGQRLLRFPVHPRQARLLVEAERRGIAEDGAALAALLGERDIRLETRTRFGDGRQQSGGTSGPSDLLELLERFRQGQASSARSAGLDPGALNAAERVRRQLLRLSDASVPLPADPHRREEAQLIAILAGSPDRVAKRRRPRAPEIVFAGGGAGTLDPASVVHDAELMVAVDAEERKGGVVVRLASRIEAEWLLELMPDELTEVDELQWNAQARRVERVARLALGNVTLDESRTPAPPSEQTTKLLADAAVAAGPGAFTDRDKLESFRYRVEALRAGFPDAGFAAPDDTSFAEVLRAQCEGLRSFRELEEIDLLDAVRARLTPEQSKLLATQAPERITLPGGRSVQVHYEAGKPPWIESRLQDFFGLTAGPTIGRSALVLHLLAPNQRAVQVTTDLAGFWDRHYPAIRKELMRQYPKHAWPENPRTAQPPQPRRR